MAGPALATTYRMAISSSGKPTVSQTCQTDERPGAADTRGVGCKESRAEHADG